VAFTGVLPALIEALWGDVVATVPGRWLYTALVLATVSIGGYSVLPTVTQSAVTRLKNSISQPDYAQKHNLGIESYMPKSLNTVKWITITVQSLFVISGAVALLFIWDGSDAAFSFLLLLYQTAPEVGRVTGTLIVILCAYGGSLIIAQLLERIAEQDRWDDHQARIAFRTTQVAMFAVLGLITLSIWNIDIGGLLVGAGFLGIIVGMATRQTIAALLAGFVLMFSRPFEIGDWVEVENEEGIVLDITMVHTHLENLDGEVVVLRNDMVANHTLKNKSRKGRLRITMDVSVGYDDDLDTAVMVAEESMGRVDEVVSVPNPEAIPNTFGDNGIGIELRFWIDNPNAQRRANSKAGVIKEIKQGFDQEGITIPYPQRRFGGSHPEESQQRQRTLSRFEQ